MIILWNNNHNKRRGEEKENKDETGTILLMNMNGEEKIGTNTYDFVEVGNLRKSRKIKVTSCRKK